MPTAICCVPCSPLRVEASHKSEMVSQMVFGETCQIIDIHSEHWVKVICDQDQYTGWCQDSHLEELAPDQLKDTRASLTRKWVSEIEFDGKPMFLPLGSILHMNKRGPVWAARHRIKIGMKGWDPSAANVNEKSIRKFAELFLNTTYLWGGKTVFGTDCSGFTQTVFRFFNIPLLRDASQQAGQGIELPSLSGSKPGDLAFFDNESGKITHVGILLSGGQIIHASGKVRIDRITEEGIIPAGGSVKTHSLKMIRQYF